MAHVVPNGTGCTGPRTRGIATGTKEERSPPFDLFRLSFFLFEFTRAGPTL